MAKSLRRLTITLEGKLRDAEGRRVVQAIPVGEPFVVILPTSLDEEMETCYQRLTNSIAISPEMPKRGVNAYVARKPRHFSDTRSEVSFPVQLYKV